jgi:hypothetical protein
LLFFISWQINNTRIIHKKLLFHKIFELDFIILEIIN